MKKHVVVVLAVGLLIGADKKDEAKKELKKFQGEWVPVSVEINGKAIPEEAIKNVKVTVKGNKLTFTEGGTTIEGTFTLDPTRKPKQIDGKAKGPQGKEVKTIGIYELDGDKLKICDTLAGGERPRKFSSKGGTPKNPITLTVYKRAKKDK
jgi:uncharacterized protein (TIGR03067 family)